MTTDTALIKLHNKVEDVIGERLTLRGNKAKCPFHDDHTPSLSVDPKRQIWKCFGCNVGGDVISFIMRYKKTDFRGALSILTNRAGLEDKHMQKECEYIYQTITGEPYIRMERMIAEDGDKKFLASSWNGSDWASGLNGKDLIPYNLPSLAGADTILIPEGEKCCDKLASLGFVATTNPFGAKKWKPEFASYFIGRKIVVFEDNDQPGRDHAQMIIASLFGKVAEIKLISFQNLPEGGDIADWLNAHSKEELLQLIESTPAITVLPSESDIHINKGLKLTNLKDLLAEPEKPVDWVVDNFLSSGGLSVIVAKPKVGKSTIARQMALCISRGDDFLGHKCMQGTVIYLSLEERRSDVKAHFIRMGASESDDGIEIFAEMAPSDVIAQFRAMAEFKRPKLIFVDTLVRLVRPKDSNSYSEITLALEPILATARETCAHVCLLHHAKKGDGKSIDSILGSTAIAGSVDTIILVHRSDRFRTISTIQRAGQDLPETVLDFDSERGWSSLAGTKEDCEINQVKQEILDFLSRQTEVLEEKCIHEEIEGKRTHKLRALRELVKEGKITRLGEGKRKQPFLYHHSGILVPSISPVPEYQNPKSDLTSENIRADSGIEHSEQIPLPVDLPDFGPDVVEDGEV